MAWSKLNCLMELFMIYVLVTGRRAGCLESIVASVSSMQHFFLFNYMFFYLFRNSFGITPTMEKMHHVGTMRTKMDDCQFVCIAQSEYYRILHQGEENTRKLEENGRVVLVTEHRVLDRGTRRGHVVIRG